ncbi:MAG: ABC transporter substrate-binding protein [Deinococcales bacterium]|jgi:branched-chain amino acid transport system substrate-binding protein
MRRTRVWILLLLMAGLAAFGTASAQDIVIGAAIAQTGPASSLGTGEVDALKLFEKQVNDAGGIDGHNLKIVLLDTASDPSKAVLNVRKLITEDNALAVICCTTSPESLAVIDTVQRAGVPNISIAASASIVQPASERHWIFKTPPLDSVMVTAEVKDMVAQGVKTLGFIGFNDAYGQGGLDELKKALPGTGIDLVDAESFARTDTNLSSQASKLVAAKPDAVLIWAIPPGGNVAQKALQDAGYQGTFYQSYGMTNETFLRLGGASLNGTRLSVLPVIVHDNLPSSLPFASVVQDFVQTYQAAYGSVPSSFAGHAWDAGLILEAASKQVLASTSPSDVKAFRSALRDAIEGLHDFQAVDGTFNFSPTDHSGLGSTSAVMVTVQDGTYQPVP